ncbi:MAG: hypothetical protein M3O64_03920 [Chloroflexota bacterium]|nr:hypothetical protein [Chloroflexota bacterium]
MNNRNRWIAAAVVAVIAIVIVLGLRSPEQTASVASPSLSPTTSVRASATASAAASATAGPTGLAVATGATGGTGAVYNDDFGFVIQGQPGSTIRKESSSGAVGPAPALRVPAFGANIAVSPDGTLIAYWKPGPGQGGEGAQLRMFAVAGNSTEQTLVSLAADTRGGGIVWSSDNAGILYSTETGAFGIGSGSNANKATLNIYELAANGRHGIVIDTQTNTGWLYRPVAWDRSANLAAAGLTGEGGFMGFYGTVRLNADNTFTAQRAESAAGGITMGSVHASSDAKLVLGSEISGKVSYWPLADFAARTVASGTGQKGAQWQPGSHRIGFLNASDGFVLFQADDGSATTSFTGVKAGANLAAFRADGTAVALFFISGPTSPGSRWDYTLYRLSDGANVSFQDGGALTASVRFR